MANGRLAGNALCSEGLYGEAANAYRNALLEGDLTLAERADILASLAIACLKAGDAASAVESCSSALKLDSRNERVLKTAIKAYQQVGDQSAVREAKLALRHVHDTASTPSFEAPLMPIPLAEPLAEPLAQPPAQPLAKPADTSLVQPAGVRARYTGLSPETDALAVEASLGDLRSDLGPKLESLIAGIDRWVDKLERSSKAQQARLDAPAPATGPLCVCVSFEQVALRVGPHGLNQALLDTAKPGGGAASEPPSADPEQAEARELGLRQLALETLRGPMPDAAELAEAECADQFAEWCEEASREEWHVCVLSASFKPVVRHFLRQAGLGHVTALAAYGRCRSEADGGQWEAMAWTATDRVRALRSVLSSAATPKAGEQTRAQPAAQLVLIGAHAHDAQLLLAEPAVVSMLYVLVGSPLEQWCQANGVQHRKFCGFDRFHDEMRQHCVR